ncbi:hypothetical protein [Legionella quateirensis]|uniref:Uncharacterized protein n=1 Tax=Legionella quateirensis TaxID=45072 RepID=A0A378KZH1_9GAMM|nr:hypothetical protein [Legionella quateirensis]KTD44844.1 hypothetical protein Lqua_2679 [Legionella quateirensis]STY17250.1 Uncharacterised protein [Legionella quateirensis]
MSSKSNRKKVAFDKAKASLENTISNLKKCDSYDRLQTILKTIDKAKKITQSPYRLVGLSEYHTSELNRLKTTIDSLVKEKSLAFPKPVQPVQTVEVIVNEQVSAPVSQVKDSPPVIESSEHTDSIPVEETKKSSVQPKVRRNKERDPVRMNELSNVLIQLEHLRDKIEELYKKSQQYELNRKDDKAELYHNTATAGRKVLEEIATICSAYAEKKIDLDTFKQQSTDYLKNDNQYVTQLKTHRGCKDIIANLLLALTGVGLLAIAAVSVYSGRLTMFNLTNTDSGNKVDALTDSLENVKSSVSPK